MSKYRCPTLGDCDRANAGEIFERSAGDDVKCPGCGTLLESVDKSGGASSTAKPATMRVAAIAAAVIALAGGGWFAMRKPASVPLAEAAATPVAAPAAASASPSTLPPSDADIARQSREGQAGLAGGQASSAEAASAKAAANEMIKVGIARLAQGKLDEAEKSFRSAAEIDPKQSLGYYNMAILRLRQGRTDDALKEFEACFMAGFEHFDKMAQDTDLDEIRKDKRFTELVARYQKAR